MSSVLLKAGCFFLIILMGYGLKKIGLLSQTDLPVFSKLVTKITLPAAIIHNFSQATMDVSMLVIVLIGFLCSGAYAVIGYGLFAIGLVGSEMCIRDSRKCVGIQYRLLYDAFRPGILRSAGRGLYQPF